MRFITIKGKKAMDISWSMLGWFLFTLLCLIIVIFLMGKFSGSSSNMLDKLFEW